MYKKIITSLVSTMLTVTVVYGGFSLYQAGAAGESSFDSNFYHDEMNEIFNERISKLVEIIEKENFWEDPNFLAPENAAGCTEENVSTYCLSQEGLESLMSFLEEMNLRKGEFADSFWTSSSDRGLDVLAATDLKNIQIDQEMRDAERALDAALAVYNEFSLAYVMHERYEEIIDNLVKYKLALEDVRKEVQQFPGRFIDSTSEICE